jgi:hypothetical protein
MRRYDIVSGILLILSITDFALAAPVPVQGNSQASADVVYIPKDAMAMPRKRGGEELEELSEQYLKMLEKPIDSSDAHAASSLAQPGSDHGSTDVVQGPAPNPASSTANPDPSMEPSSPLSTTPMQGSDQGSNKGSPMSVYYTADESMAGDSPQSNPNLNTLPAGLELPPGADPNFDWAYWINFDDSPARPASKEGFDPTPGDQVGHVQQPDQGLSTDPNGPDPNFDWGYWGNLKDTPPQSPGSNKIGPGPDSQHDDAQHLDSDPGFPNLKVKTKLESVSPHMSDLAAGSPISSANEMMAPPSPDLGSLKPQQNEVLGPPPTPEPEAQSDYPSSSTGPRPEEVQAATLATIYKMKGKAKELRRVSVTDRDVDNAARRIGSG